MKPSLGISSQVLFQVHTQPIGEQSMVEKAKYCGKCGETHSGECDPNSFVYYTCDGCERLQMLPWDVTAFCGLKGMHCGCGAKADKSWKPISHIKYLELKNEQESQRKTK